jgi:hypothetical protein
VVSVSCIYIAEEGYGVTDTTANRETKHKTLEEIAAAFGDRVVVADDVSKAPMAKDEVGADHVESSKPTEEAIDA